LIALCFDHRREQQIARWVERLDVDEVSEQSMPEISDALCRYFARDWAAFDQVPIAPIGTPFQRDVWRALRTIPAGTTWSYKALAEAVGRPTAYRAVANANRQNPLPLIVPCHRVIAADGRLRGFAGGLQIKAQLLSLEGAAFRP
jgi:methylated-DNA-[protein]-cysteine S-methyltransferase